MNRIQIDLPLHTFDAIVTYKFKSRIFILYKKEKKEGFKNECLLLLELLLKKLKKRIKRELLPKEDWDNQALGFCQNFPYDNLWQTIEIYRCTR